MKAIKLHKNQGILFKVVNNCYVFLEYKIKNVVTKTHNSIFIKNIEKCLNDIKKSDNFKSKKHSLLIKIGKYIKNKKDRLRKISENGENKSLEYSRRQKELRELSKLKKFTQCFEMQPKFQKEIIGKQIVTNIWF